MKIIGVVGARPNFMKIAPLIAAMRHEPDVFDFTLVHTGQHYDTKMNEVFFSELGIPKPDVHLGVGSGSHAEQTARVMVEFEKLLLERRPHLVIVVGDVNSTMAAAIVAAKLKICLAHVEAGLRSFDRRMPEEINRVVTDVLSDVLFTTSRIADRNLIAEGVPREKICLVGNVMIDTLIGNLEKAVSRRTVLDLGLEPGGYGLVTLHRPSNVDASEELEGVAGALAQISRKLPLVFPVHPRTRKQLEAYGILPTLEREPSVRLIEPLGYLDFLCLMRSAKMVISDSGGIQEESTYLRIPCLTLRENTERPETIEQGTNLLVGSDPELIYTEAVKTIEGRGKQGSDLEFWDGGVAERIVAELKKRRRWLMAPVAGRVVKEAQETEKTEAG
ncbi:MAG: UDP-N-acetylglucosamine 2-epimerase (non-hydrolyzing) [Gemmatimonadota bacterium]|nr:UDP-N-acetylglucosamine 2-epimerase (non-hydrolyzing) [Gemmatimonadota bacterium]